MPETSVVLPLEIQPPVQSYQHHAFWLSMILGNDPDMRPFLTMHYTNLMWDAQEKMLNPYIYSDWRFETEQLLPTKFLVNVPPKMVRGYRSFDLVALLCDMLDHGFYQMGTFDEFYVPAKGGYQKRHFVHNNLIYGYNDDARQFLSIGYTKNRIYEPFTVSYTDYVESVYRLEQRFIGALFCFYQPNAACRFDPDRYRRILYDYVTSANKGTAENGYGLGCLEKAAADLSETDDRAVLDLRPLRVILEHARMMHEGLTQLQKSGVPADPAPYAHAVACAEAALNLGIKFHMVRDPGLLKKAAEEIREMICVEQELLPPLAAEKGV